MSTFKPYYFGGSLQARFDGKNKNPWQYYNWSQPYRKANGKKFTIEPGKKHRYTILQLHNSLTVKIDNVLVYAISITPVIGKTIGVQQCLKSSWQMNQLIIRQ